MAGRTALGWDIGGANLQAAALDGVSVRTLVRPLEIWKDPGALEPALSEVAGALGTPGLMAVTMTAELADCFPTKGDGVAFVLGALGRACPDATIRVFGSDGRFRTPQRAIGEPLAVASANWAATAMLAARCVESALLIDVGTTTTDIVPLSAGRIAAFGRTDPERLAAGELVYTGAVRTPVCAVARTVPFRGQRCRTAAERFAQTGDVHLWLGDLEADDYTGETPDGRGTGRDDIAARLARIVCADRTMATDDDLTALARHIAERQVRLITAAIRQIRSRLGAEAPSTALTTGVGTFLARRACDRVGLERHDLAEALGREADRAAPAVAVARLLLDIETVENGEGSRGPE